MGGVSQNKRPKDAEPEVSSAYVSPLKRVKAAVARQAKKQVLEGAKELKQFIEDHDMKDPSVSSSIMLRLRLVWTSFETCRTGPVARLHLIDKRADDKLEDLYTGLRDDCKNRRSIVDEELITASIYGVDEKKKSEVPADGVIVSITTLWSLQLYMNRACQLTTNLDSVKVESQM